jgi:NADPH:quinone reductase-like Zn-dependent oxidoreductase
MRLLARKASGEVFIFMEWKGGEQMELKPFDGGVVVRLNTYDKIRGITLPQNAGKDMEIEVVAIGPGVTKVKPGDRIVISPMFVLFLKDWLNIDPNMGVCKEEHIAAVLVK